MVIFDLSLSTVAFLQVFLAYRRSNDRERVTELTSHLIPLLPTFAPRFVAQ